jgi:hypothetical protein
MYSLYVVDIQAEHVPNKFKALHLDQWVRCVYEACTFWPLQNRQSLEMIKLAQFFIKIHSLWSLGRELDQEGSLPLSQVPFTWHRRETLEF